jgi:hypothetical protein
MLAALDSVRRKLGRSVALARSLAPNQDNQGGDSGASKSGKGRSTKAKPMHVDLVLPRLLLRQFATIGGDAATLSGIAAVIAKATICAGRESMLLAEDSRCPPAELECEHHVSFGSGAIGVLRRCRLVGTPCCRNSVYRVGRLIPRSLAA